MRRLLNNIKNHTNWLAYLLRKLTGNKKSDFTFKGRTGLNIKVPARLMHTYKECFFDQTYTRGLPDNLLSEFKGKENLCVIDVGANVGYFSLSVLSMFPKAAVYAFEPMPMNFKLLKKYQDENPSRKLTAVNEAVGGTTEILTLNYNASDEFSTSASVFDTRPQPDQIKVQCTILPEVMKRFNLSQIDLLKLDCEGSEYGILYKASDDLLKKITSMAIETHVGKGEKENTQSLVEFLRTKNFTVKADGDIVWAWRI